QRDRGHLLVDILRDGIEGGRGHIDAHENHRDRAERERDWHSGKHRKQGGDGVTDANSKHGHRRFVPVRGMITCSRICTHNSVMPTAIRPYGISKGGAHMELDTWPSSQAS